MKGQCTHCKNLFWKLLARSNATFTVGPITHSFVGRDVGLVRDVISTVRLDHPLPLVRQKQHTIVGYGNNEIRQGLHAEQRRGISLGPWQLKLVLLFIFHI